jgi:hypothetical protein
MFPDQCGRNGRLYPALQISRQLFAAASVDGHFEAWDAQAGGLKLSFVGGEMLAVGFGVVGRKQDGAAGQACFDGIHRRDGFFFRSGRTVESWALARLAARRAPETGSVSPGCCGRACFSAALHALRSAARRIDRAVIWGVLLKRNGS